MVITTVILSFWIKMVQAVECRIFQWVQRMWSWICAWESHVLHCSDKSCISDRANQLVSTLC